MLLAMLKTSNTLRRTYGLSFATPAALLKLKGTFGSAFISERDCLCFSKTFARKGSPKITSFEIPVNQQIAYWH